MTAPQSPAPAQSLLEEMGDALKYARRFLNPHDHDVAYIDVALSRYRAAKAAEPDIATTLEKLIRACTPTRRGKEAGEVPMSGSRMPEQAIVEQANLVLAEYRAALAAAQAKEG